MKSFTAALLGLALVGTSSATWAETPAAPAVGAAPSRSRPEPRRRAAKHDQARSAAVRGGRVQVMKDIWIVGRPQRPMSVFDAAPQRFDFPVGTARYSPRDRAFLPADTQERW